MAILQLYLSIMLSLISVTYGIKLKLYNTYFISIAKKVGKEWVVFLELGVHRLAWVVLVASYEISLQITSIFFVFPIRHIGHLGGASTKDFSLVSIAHSSNMAAGLLTF